MSSNDLKMNGLDRRQPYWNQNHAIQENPKSRTDVFTPRAGRISAASPYPNVDKIEIHSAPKQESGAEFALVKGKIRQGVMEQLSKTREQQDLNELKQSIQSGAYQIDAADIASKMLGR